MGNNRTGTKTSAFGVSGRYGHDSSVFYASNLYSSFKENEKEEYTSQLKLSI